MRNSNSRHFQIRKLKFVSNFEFRASNLNWTKSGFTLVELLVVLAILLVITGISVTSIPSFASPRQRLRTEARDLMSLLRDARQTAMSRKIKIDICVSSETGTVRALETVCARKLTAAGDSLFEEELTNTNCYQRAVSFGEDTELDIFSAEEIEDVLSSEEDPFSEAADGFFAPEEMVAFTFTHFGGASGGGISLIRADARLDIACDILTGEPETVKLHSSEGNQ